MSNSIYRVTEVIGTSTEKWKDATRHAVETAAKTLRDLRVGEVCQLDDDRGRPTYHRLPRALKSRSVPSPTTEDHRLSDWAMGTDSFHARERLPDVLVLAVVR